MSETFIIEWQISDYAGRRNKNIVSKGTINGEHIYACEKLTTWSRLGKYLIKHDFANYLLGITKYIPDNMLKTNVRYREYLPTLNKMVERNCVDDIVRLVHEKLGEDFDYVAELQMLQRELEGYEWCFNVSQCHGWEFDYKRFLRNKKLYRFMLWLRYKYTRAYWILEDIFHKDD